MKKIGIILLGILVLVGCTPQKKAYVQPEVPSLYYEIFVASFYDSNGDGVGDLEGVKEKLPYIQETLGVSNLWLMPINPSPSYHKYDVVDYYDIDKSYGDIESMKSLLSSIKDRDMTLIMDLVLNHTSSDHPWFKEAVAAKQSGTCSETKYCDYYNFSDSWEKGYNEVSSGLWYESVFTDSMPDLNLDNPEVRNEIKEIVTFWFNLGVSGFRLDATTHFYEDETSKNTEFLSWFNAMAKEINPQAYIVGEAWVPNSTIAQMYDSKIDSFFNFGVSQAQGDIVKSIKKGDGQALSKKVADYNDEIRSYNPKAKDAPFLSNHDNGRSASYFADEKEQKLAASIYLTMPGTPFIYYGEEIGLKGSGVDENKRLPMVWSQKDDKGKAKPPKNADYTVSFESSVEDQLKDSQSLLNHYIKVIEIRNKYSQISTAHPLSLPSDSSLYVMQFDDIIVIYNLSSEKQSLTGKYEILDIISGDAKGEASQLSIEGYSSLVIKNK
ncbi:MAG: alpha-amylase family glycosyl hydrolase [Erysipelothrix sp.]